MSSRRADENMLKSPEKPFPSQENFEQEAGSVSEVCESYRIFRENPHWYVYLYPLLWPRMHLHYSLSRYLAQAVSRLVFYLIYPTWSLELSFPFLHTQEVIYPPFRLSITSTEAFDSHTKARMAEFEQGTCSLNIC